MFIKTVCGEVESNAWKGVDVNFAEVASLDEARAALMKIISLDHDYPEEWLARDVKRASESAATIQCDGESFRIRSTDADDSETYSVYEYSIVSEND